MFSLTEKQNINVRADVIESELTRQNEQLGSINNKMDTAHERVEGTNSRVARKLAK